MATSEKGYVKKINFNVAPNWSGWVC